MFLGKNFVNLCVVAVFVLLPGCVPYHKIGKTEFPQGQSKDPARSILVNNLRSTRVYDQFNTLATFDVLWLSDQTRTYYTELYSTRRGKDAESTDALLRRQLEENKLWISFYVLADVRGDSNNQLLSEKNAAWTMYLKNTAGATVTPILVKEIMLEPEIMLMFGSLLNSFKTAFIVKFPVQDLAGAEYLKEKETFKLVISSVRKSCELEWSTDSKLDKKAIRAAEKRMKTNEDLDWF